MTTQPTSTPPSKGSAFGSNMKLSGPLGVSLAAIAVGIIVGVWGFFAIASATFGRGTGDVQPDKEIDRLMAKHTEDQKLWQDRFNGRSPIFKPPAPLPPKPIEVPRPIEEPKPIVVESTIDTVYRGPSIAFAYADVVYFNPVSASDAVKYLRVRVGEEKSGVKVVSVALPWTVKVGYKGGEYDVPIFNRAAEETFLLTSAKPVILTNFLVAVPGADAVATGASPASPDAVNTAAPAPQAAAVSVQPAVANPATTSSPDRPPPGGRSSRGNRGDRGGRGGSQETPQPNPPQPEPEPSGEEGGVQEEPATGDEPAADDDTVPEEVEPTPAPEAPGRPRS